MYNDFMTFYTYLWLRERDGTFPAGAPYYAGKGKGDRAWEIDGHTHRPPTDLNLILIQFWPSEADAFEAEKFLISFYGRIDRGTGCLRNLTDGGDNPPSQLGKHWRLSKESRQRISKARTGMTFTETHRANISNSKTGKSWSPAKRASYEESRKT